jgi:hypothetical protein
VTSVATSHTTIAYGPGLPEGLVLGAA